MNYIELLKIYTDSEIAATSPNSGHTAMLRSAQIAKGREEENSILLKRLQGVSLSNI